MKTLVLLLAATAALAQNAAPPKPDPIAPGEVIRVVDVKAASAYTIQQSLGQIFPGISRVEGQLIVRGQPAVVDMIEAAIKKLDVAPPPPPGAQPSPNVELTVQLLLGSAQELPSAKVPSDLEPTVRQLRSLFPYKSYRVLDTQLLRTRGNASRGLEASGTLPGSGTDIQPTSFSFRVTPSVMPGPGRPYTIRLTGLQMSLQMPIKIADKVQERHASITTELDAKEGQKTVVGKANLANSEDAIFLVITPTVIE